MLCTFAGVRRSIKTSHNKSISVHVQYRKWFNSNKSRTFWSVINVNSRHTSIYTQCMCATIVTIFSYKRVHVFFFFWTFCGCSTARIASSNTVFKPFCVSAEHSRYFTAPISFCICNPCGYVMGASRFSFSFSIVSLSSRKSSFVPTRMMGVFGQWWLTSGYHYTGWGETITGGG